MENQADNKFTWVIKNFSSLQSERIYSDHFVSGGCKWRLLAFPKGNKVVDYLSLYLDVPLHTSLPTGWKRHVQVSFTIVNQLQGKPSHLNETQHCFEQKEPDWGFRTMIPLNERKAKDSGFLLNGELKIVAEVEVLEVIGNLDVTEETSSVKESVNVNGFQVLPSQVNTVNRLFERHPDIASNLRIKNQYMKTGHMNVLLSLIETLRQSPQNISTDDLADAYAALGSVTEAGFKLDWLEKKLNELSKKKVKEEACEARMKELDKKMKGLKKICSDVEALQDREQAELLAIRAPLSEDDIF